MTRFRFPLSRRAGFRAVMVGVAVSAVGLMATVASALPAGTAPQNGGGINLAPSSGTFADPFALRFEPTNQACPGNNTTGWFYSPYLTADDPAQLVFSPAGSPQSALSGRTVALRDSLNELVRNKFPDLDTFILAEPTGLSFANTFAASPLTPGIYNVGIACFNANAVDGLAVRENAKFWNTRISVTEAGGIYSYAPAPVDNTTTTTTTTVVDGTTTTTTVAGGSTTTTTVAGGTTSTTVAGGSTSATVTPSSPTPGGAYSVAFPNCTVGETVTFTQSQSTPTSVTDVCEASSALTSGSVAGFRMPTQATTGTATGSFTAAPTAPGSYTVTMTGTVSTQRTVTFVVVGASTPVVGGNATTGGSPTSSSTGTIPSTGSSTTSLIVWGVLLLVFGRIAMLLGRKPKVLTGT